MPDLHLMRVDSMQIGYGRMGVMIDRTLRGMGLDISNDIDGDPAGTVLLCSTPAHLLRYRDGQSVNILTMWESLNLPEAFRESLHLFETIIVPSQQNVELFGEFHDNVKMVPLGIDPAVWHPTTRTPPRQRFVFLIGGSGDRKGVDLAYRAFRLAFPAGSWGDGPEPWLRQKSPKVIPFHGDRVEQINGRVSNEDEVALYAAAHCYLQPSRGEGFGLQPLQAIAQGLPTILTAAHGHESFAHLGYGIPAAHRATKPGSFMLGEAGDWWEPDLDSLVTQMRWVYDNYDQACRYAADQAEIAVQKFTWDSTGRGIIAALPELTPYSGSGEWRVPEYKQFRIVLNRHHRAEHAGMAYSWEPFTEYFVSADLKRVLFEGGYLDPSCVFGDTGISPDRIAASGLKSGAESTCGTCGQTLGTMPTRADLAERAFNATN